MDICGVVAARLVANFPTDKVSMHAGPWDLGMSGTIRSNRRGALASHSKGSYCPFEGPRPPSVPRYFACSERGGLSDNVRQWNGPAVLRPHPASDAGMGRVSSGALPCRLNSALGSPACFQGHPRLPVGNCFPPKRLASASASSGSAKQNTTTSLSSRRREYVSDVADR